MKDCITVWHCPQCSAELTACGMIESEGREVPVFQCETCTETREVFGEPFEVALTFGINADGRPYDIATDELI